MKSFRMSMLLVVTVALLAGAVYAQTPADKTSQTMIEAMRKDIRTQKQSLVDQGMGLEAAQKAQFWSIYNGYQAELDKIGDQRVANIKMYADNFDKMTDTIADQLAVKALDIEAQRTALKKKYYGVFKEKMGARVAARFLQVESLLGAALEVQLGSSIPILQ